MAGSSTGPGTVDDSAGFTLFRRVKLWLDAVPSAVLDRALELGLLVRRLGRPIRRGERAAPG